MKGEGILKNTLFERTLFYPSLSVLILFFFITTVTLFGESTVVQTDGITITVEKGQTLSLISKTYLDDPKKWKELLKSNKIENPNLIKPGMKLWIPASLGKKPIAEVGKFRGISSVILHSKKETSWTNVTPKLGLYLHDEARTLEESVLELLLNSGSVLELSQNSQLVIEKVKTDNDPDHFFLRKGRLKAFVSKNRESMKKMFILRTPAALAEVKGTEFITEVDQKENTNLACYEGSVAVSAQNVTVLVNAGYATFVEKGKPPQRPFLIPIAPDIKK